MISPELMTAYKAELERGYSSLARGELAGAFQCFERTHSGTAQHSATRPCPRASLSKTIWVLDPEATFVD